MNSGLKRPPPSSLHVGIVGMLLSVLTVSLAGCQNDDDARPGVRDACSLSDSLVTFDSVLVGDCTPVREVTLRNLGASPLAGVLSLSSPDFQCTGGGGSFALAGGESRTIGIRFCPAAAERETCEVSTGIPGCPRFRCVGTGLAEPSAVGACCDLTLGHCTVTRREDCSPLNVWLEPWTHCNPNPCPPSGACCKDSNCTLTTQEGCLGTWLGQSTSCAPANPCILAACCDPTDGSCAMTREGQCAPPREWQGATGSCTPNPCPQPEGACCALDGSCRISLRALCSSPDLWYRSWTTCEPNPCPPPPGACCVPNGVCEVTTQAGCREPKTWQGDRTVCDPNPCPKPPTGACCRETKCEIDNPYDCDMQGGFYLGDETACVPCICIPCPPSPITIYASMDVTISSGSAVPDACHSILDRVGHDSGGPGELSTLFLFNLSAIPPCATIVDVGLEFYGDRCEPEPVSGRVPVMLSRNLGPWAECSISWGTAPASLPLSECRTNLYCAPAAYFGAGCPELLDLVRGWVLDPTTNYGLRVGPADETDGAVRIHSRRHSEAQTLPKIVVHFVCPGE